MKVGRYYPAVSAAAILMALAAPCGWAQDNSESEDESTTDRRLDTVTVTANKRSEDINDVGLSIAAFSGAELEARRLDTLEDFATAVPGLVYSPSDTNTPIFTLRGVGFNESSLGVYPAVSVYADEVPLVFPVLASHAAYDSQRVEVLKGPQGTLFGQNSTGGAINFIANKPTDEPESRFKIGYGSFDTFEASGAVSGPLNDKVSARFAFDTKTSDDWQESASRTDENGSISYTAGRFLLAYEHSENVRFMLNLNGWQDQSDPLAQQHVAVRAKTPSAPNTALLDAQPFTVEDNEAADWSEIAQPEADRKFFQSSLRGEFDVSPELTVTSITAYTDYTQEQVIDRDGMALSGTDLTKADGTIQSFVQELRLANSGTGNFTWLVGANYEDSSTQENQRINFSDGTSSRPQTLDFFSVEGELIQDIRSYAVFANAEYSLTDRLDVKASARFTDTEIEASHCIQDADGGLTNTVLNGLGGLLGGGTPFVPLGTGGPGCISLNFDGVPNEIFTDTLSEDNVSWRVGADYDLSDSTLLYGLVARGYKAGSYPSLPAAASWDQFLPVVQEEVTAYEAGIKSTLANGLAQFNAAAFFYDYKDKQVRGKIPDPVFATLDALVNVPESHLTGVEAELTLRPADRLTLSGAVTYLDSEVDEYTGYSVIATTAAEVTDFSGEPLPFTPELSYSLNVDYRVPLNGGDLFFGGTYHGQSDSDAAFGGSSIVYPNTPPDSALTPFIFKIEDYALLDLRAGYDGGNWMFTVWGKNVTDEYYFPTVIPGSDTASRIAGRPATFGATLSMEF